MSYFNKFRTSELPAARFLFSGAIVMGGFFVVNVLNYVFTLIVSRLLPVAEFGEISALFSLLIIVSVPGTALSMLIANEVAFERGSDRAHQTLPHLIHFVRRHIIIAGFILWLIGFACSPYIAHGLHIPLTPVFIFSLLIPLSLFSSLQSGALQGMQEFLTLSGQSIIGTIIKLLGSIVLVEAGYSVTGVITALVLGTVASSLFGFFVLRSKVGVPTSIDDSQFDLFARIRSSVLIALLTTLLLALLSNVDVLLAKHYLSAADAGLYGALSTVGKILVYGIGAFITVLLPMASEAHAREGLSASSGRTAQEASAAQPVNARKILFFSLLLIAVTAIFVCTVFAIRPLLFVRILFGTRYDGIAPYLAPFSVGMSFVALSTALINYFIAIRDNIFIRFFAAGLILEVVLLMLYHASISNFVSGLVIAWSVLFMFLGFRFLYIRDKERARI